MFELRMECLRLASGLVTSANPEDVVKAAEKLMAFIKPDAAQPSQCLIPRSETD